MMCRYAGKYYFEEGSETADTVLDITDRCAAAGLSDEEISTLIVVYLTQADAGITNKERLRVAVFARQQELAGGTVH